MFGALSLRLLGASCLVVAVFAYNEDGNCNCEEEGFWSVHNILWLQRVSDFFIAFAYFSIPIELLYFVSCSNFPFKWVLLQFIAFIVLCGLSHLLNGWTYYGPHSFQLMMSLTVAKFLTALVSCATAITLLTLIPLLLKVKVRELFLRQNVLELDQEVGIIKRQKEANLHVRMLTQEIRKSLDKHTILYTTLVELSKTLDLHSCAVWMPNESRPEMNLTHELRESSGSRHLSIPIDDPDVVGIKHSKGVKLLGLDSALVAASGGEAEELGAVAAIRMPLLQVSNFKGGTPELVDTHYAILVLVLPSSDSRIWSYGEMEIVEVVADQVAVALSHADVLEESQLMREKLSEQNHALQQAKKNAMMASQARNLFQKVMSHGMRRPMHSIMGFLSLVVDENLSFEQRLVVDTLVKTSNVLSTLINDVMDISTKDSGRFPLEMRPFRLHSTIKEAFCLAKCFCAYRGFGFEVDVQSSLPDIVLGDERRAFQVILHMVGYLLNIYDGGVTVVFRVSSERVSGGNIDRLLGMWKTTSLSEHVSIKFEFQIKEETSLFHASTLATGSSGRRLNSGEVKEGLSFRMCRKLVQMMQGDIWITSDAFGFPRSMTLFLQLQTPSPYGRAIGIASSTEQPESNSQFKGLRVIIADDDGVNRTVTSRMLQKLGCEVTAVSSGFECLSALCSAGNSFRVVILDLHMPEMDGFEVAMRIRKYCSRNWPMIIALTASAEDQVWERCLQMGMNGVVQKPVPLQGIADELRRVLQRAG